MTPSKRLAQETTFTQDFGDYHCTACDAEFSYDNLNDGAYDPKAPKFCPNCGRKAAQTK